EVHYFKQAQDTIWASTILGGEKKVADHFFAFPNVRFGQTALRGMPDNEVDPAAIQQNIDNGHTAIILVDSGYLQNLDNRYPNFGRHESGNLAGTHYICMLSARADGSGNVTMQWCDYGGKHSQQMSLNDFQRMVWGGIYISAGGTA